MTPDVYRQIVGDQLGATGVEEQIEAMTRFRALGYLAIPVVVWTRIAFMALIVQMFCLLGMVEIPFWKLFRVASIAFVGPLVGSLNRIVWIARQEHVDAATLTFTPGSLAAISLQPSAAESWTYVLLSQLNVSQLVWIVLIVAGLIGTKRLRVVGATVVAGSAWGLMTFFRVAFALYLQHFGTGL